MISKYAYKNLTWIDLKSPTKEEIDHILNTKPDDALHFIVGDDMLITTRKHDTETINTFAKNFEMNVNLEKPIQTESIDFLFFELLSFFKKHAENTDYQKSYIQTNTELLLLQNSYTQMKNKLIYRNNILKTVIILLFIVIIFLFLWL